MKLACIVLIIVLIEVNGGIGHALKGTEYGFSTHGTFWRKEIEGSESGGYLTSKYKQYIECVNVFKVF